MVMGCRFKSDVAETWEELEPLCWLLGEAVTVEELAELA